MAEKRFKAVLEIGGSVGSSLKSSFATVTGNTKKLGASLKELQSSAKKLRSEMRNGLAGDAAERLAKLDRQIALTKRRMESLNTLKSLNIGDKIRNVGSTFARGVAVDIAAATAIGAALYKAAASYGNYADNSAEAAQKLSMNTNALIKYKYAAADVGVSAETLEKSLAAMQLNLEKARKGGGGGAFKLLKLDVMALSRMKPEQQIEAISEAFKNYHGKVSKTAIAMGTLGKGGKEMVNFLDLGKEKMKEYGDEARLLGLLLSDEQLLAGDQFGTATNKFDAALQGIRNTIGEQLLPVITELSDEFVKFVIKHKDDIGKFAKDFADKLPGIIKDIGDFGKKIKLLGEEAGKLLGPLGGTKTAIIALAAAPFIPAIASIVSLGAAMIAAAPSAWALASGFLGLSVAGAPVWAVLLAIGATIWSVNKIVKELSDNWDTYSWAFNESIGKIVSDWNEIQTAAESFGFNAMSSIQGAFDSLRSSVGSWFDWINGKFADLNASLKTIDTAMSIGKTISSGPVGIATAATKAIVGKSVAEKPVDGARADGGPVNAGRKYLVGERGPEIFAPRTSGQIIPNGGGGRVFNITNHFTIHPSQGMDEMGLADLIVSRLDGRQAALAGGALFD